MSLLCRPTPPAPRLFPVRPSASRPSGSRPERRPEQATGCFRTSSRSLSPLPGRLPPSEAPCSPAEIVPTLCSAARSSAPPPPKKSAFVSHEQRLRRDQWLRCGHTAQRPWGRDSPLRSSVSPLVLGRRASGSRFQGLCPQWVAGSVSVCHLTAPCAAPGT